MSPIKVRNKELIYKIFEVLNDMNEDGDERTWMNKYESVISHFIKYKRSKNKIFETIDEDVKWVNETVVMTTLLDKDPMNVSVMIFEMKKGAKNSLGKVQKPKIKHGRFIELNAWNNRIIISRYYNNKKIESTSIFDDHRMEENGVWSQL